jgi:hypothetical protein
MDTGCTVPGCAERWSGRCTAALLPGGVSRHETDRRGGPLTQGPRSAGEGAESLAVGADGGGGVAPPSWVKAGPEVNLEWAPSRGP